MVNPQDKRTASQRIDDLERAVMSIFQVSNNMARDNSMIKDALKLLGNRVTALIQLLAGNQLGLVVGEDSVDRVMRENQVEELKEKVTNLIEQGFFITADTIGENTFVVGTENEPDEADGTPGKIVHPRLQFTLASLEKEVQDKLLGAKVGDTVTFKENALVFKVQEVYTIVNPTPAPAPEVTAPESETVGDQSKEAPAAEQSSSDAAQAAPAAPDAQAAGN
jgi:hypothetical protein